jgi:hypothetical protein
MCPKNVTVKEEIRSMDSSEKVYGFRILSEVLLSASVTGLRKISPFGKKIIPNFKNKDVSVNSCDDCLKKYPVRLKFKVGPNFG